MNFPDDVDCVIIGTGLTESIVAASLAIVGASVLHIDSNGNVGAQSSLAELNLTLLSNPIVRNCSSNFFVPDGVESVSQAPDETRANLTETQTFADVTETPVVPDSPSRVLEQIQPSQTASSAASPSMNATPPVWTKSFLIEGLRRADFDVMPRLIFAESPLVQALIRSDVTRYLEFRSVNRLLFFNPDGLDDRGTAATAAAATRSLEPSCLRSYSNPPFLVKVPVSRGEIFQTRILSLTQKRLFVSFLEWCVTVTTPTLTETTGNGMNSTVRSIDFSLDPDDAGS
ncbi:unnamed protein product [Hydatigera taeniaeformis]|uniref:ThiF domain-containing protein n=1 Tax=Hydatigena taeniaeformis TaxID=6205 RepID=A0A0R3X6P6_HYDTA|nr:unnamed protein product [Hydatigera taeniaeformis]